MLQNVILLLLLYTDNMPIFASGSRFGEFFLSPRLMWMAGLPFSSFLMCAKIWQIFKSERIFCGEPPNCNCKWQYCDGIFANFCLLGAHNPSHSLNSIWRGVAVEVLTLPNSISLPTVSLWLSFLSSLPSLSTPILWHSMASAVPSSTSFHGCKQTTVALPQICQYPPLGKMQPSAEIPLPQPRETFR